MQRESLTEWAALHGETPEPVAPPVEHCPRHGAWVARFGVVEECPECADAYDLLDRSDAWHDNPYRR